MKKIIGLLLLLCLSVAANYPTVPRTFGPTSFIPIGYLNQNFTAANSVFTSGLYKVNFNEIYINNAPFVNSNRNMTIGNMTITGNLAVQGNFNVTGNIAATFNVIAVNSLETTTISARYVTASIVNSVSMNTNSIIAATSNIAILTSTTINAAVVTTNQLFATTIFPSFISADVSVSGNVGMLKWVTGASDLQTTYNATSDIMIIAFDTITAGTGTVGLAVLSDSAATPTTVRARSNIQSTTAGVSSLVMCPIRKGDYYVIQRTSAGGSYSYTGNAMKLGK